MEDELRITNPEIRLEDRIFKRMSTRYNLVIGGMVLGFSLLVGLIMTVFFFLTDEVSTINSGLIQANTYLEMLVTTSMTANAQPAVNATGLP